MLVLLLAALIAATLARAPMPFLEPAVSGPSGPGGNFYSASFGSSMAMAGNTLLVGAPLGYTDQDDTIGMVVALQAPDDGGGTRWTELDLISSPNSTESDPPDEFGSAVDLGKTFAVIGAPTLQNTGCAYFYRWESILRGSAGPRRGPHYAAVTGELIPAGTEPGDRVGAAVACSVPDCECAIIGAPDADNKRGRAYLYCMSELKHTFESPSGSPGDRFGAAVGMNTFANGRLVIGAPGADNGLGAVYVFAANEGGSGAWGFTHKLRGSMDGAKVGGFGAALSWVGNGLLVGAPQTSTAQLTGVGAAFSFLVSGLTWNQTHAIPSPFAVDGAMFGASVDASQPYGPEGGMFNGVVGAPGVPAPKGSKVSGAAAMFPDLLSTPLKHEVDTVTSSTHGHLGVSVATNKEKFRCSIVGNPCSPGCPDLDPTPSGNVELWCLSKHGHD